MASVGTMLAALISVVAAMDEDCHDETCRSPQFLQLHQHVRDRAEVAEVRHPWPHARGRMPQQFGTTPETWTSHKLSWSFADPAGQFHNVFAGGAAIDEDQNLYQMTFKGLYAFNLSGHQLWHYATPGISNNEPALYEDLVLGSAHSTGNAFAVNRSTGKAVWVTKIAQDLGGDCGYPAAYDGVFVVGGGRGHDRVVDGGNVEVYGLDVTTGEKLWQYAVDKPVWNLTPLFPGDGSTVFMDFAGGMYKLNLHTGEEIWKTLIKDSRGSFSDGGATLGPNGMVYSCSNPVDYHGTEGSTGIVRAFYLSNGTEAWWKETEFPCNTYPAVGHTSGVDGLSVVVAPGSFMGSPHLHASILSLDAFTGEKKWSVAVKPWDGILGQAAGDVEGYVTRLQDHIQPICLPAHWSAPMIDGNGMVLVGRSDGQLYRVFGPDAGYKGVRSPRMNVSEDGVLSEAMPIGSAFLHGALSAAPGIFTISSCDTLYVFQK